MTPREWALAQLEELSKYKWAEKMARTAVACLQEGRSIPIVIANCQIDEPARDTLPVLAILQAALNRECETATGDIGILRLARSAVNMFDQANTCGAIRGLGRRGSIAALSINDLRLALVLAGYPPSLPDPQ